MLGEEQFGPILFKERLNSLRMVSDTIMFCGKFFIMPCTTTLTTLAIISFCNNTLIMDRNFKFILCVIHGFWLTGIFSEITPILQRVSIFNICPGSRPHTVYNYQRWADYDFGRLADQPTNRLQKGRLIGRLVGKPIIAFRGVRVTSEIFVSP